MILEKIKKENDIKELSEEELEILADEIREFLIQKISVTGGHLRQIWVWWSLPWRFICFWICQRTN